MFGQSDLAWRRLLGLFRKGVCENDKVTFLKKTENSKGVAAGVDPNLPNVISTNKLLKILFRYERQFANYFQHPNNLLELLRRKRFQETIYRTLAALGFVINYFPYTMLTNM